MQTVNKYIYKIAYINDINYLLKTFAKNGLLLF